MKNRGLVILVAIVAVLAAYILFYEQHQATTDERQESAHKVFPNFEQDQVTTIALSSPSVELNLEKSGGEWRITSPMSFGADPAAVRGLLESLGNLNVDRRLTAEEIDPASYGLDNPSMRVELRLNDETVHHLDVGAATPLGSNRAVSTGNSEVLLCPSSFTTHLLKTLDDWRSKNVVTVVENGVATIELTTKTERIKLVHIDENWTLIEPVADRAGPDHIRQMIADLSALKVDAFVDPASDLNALGLESPEYQLLIVPRGPEAPTRLDFGAEREENGVTQVICRRDGTDIFWVRDTIITPLSKAGVRWRDPKICSINTWDIERFEILHGEHEIVVDRKEGLWSVSGETADPAAIQDLLSAISDLEAGGYDLINPGTPELGRLVLHLRPLTPDEEAENLEIIFYEPMTSAGRAMVTVSGRDTVMSVDTSDLETILIEAEDLLPKTTSGGN